MPPRRIPLETIDAAAQRLDALPMLERPPSSYEAIKELLPRIAEARRRGHPMEVISERLTDSGIALTPRTLERYLSRARRELSEANRMRTGAEPQAQ
jgi:hypothetical protein